MAKKEIKQSKEKKHFLKDFKAELKKVSWPTPKQLINNTTVVIVIVLITALIVFALDLVFNAMHTNGVTKLQTVVQEKFSDNGTENTESTSETEETTEQTDETTETEESNSEETTTETDEQTTESNEAETTETQE
jgi:preprotein translocase subunit SecE